MSRPTQDTDRLRLCVVYGTITLYCLSFQTVPLQNFLATAQSYNPCIAKTIQVWANPRSLATTCGIIIIFFSYGYLDVSVPHVRPPYNGVIPSSGNGLPHSEIRGSIRICQSPRLIAAYHVLRRLSEPRHPPCALNSLSFVYSEHF